MMHHALDQKSFFFRQMSNRDRFLSLSLGAERPVVDGTARSRYLERV